jgi:DNA-directed RNA polymerase specialized sigma24 family protein
LIPLVFRELHRLAHHYLRAEKQGLTLQSTALVHEAYVRLVSQSPGCIQDRSPFGAIAARIMRQILVDHARTRRDAKRGPEYKLDLEEASIRRRTTASISSRSMTPCMLSPSMIYSSATAQFRNHE